ncbi:LysR family transcriptional regulator, partial [Neisseria sp. P0015.S004]
MQDIKPLLVFVAVLEHGSMNAAAAALGMTPSAVSQHINRLETLHGIKLLNRSTRSLAPTDAGRALGEYCRRLAATLADTRTVIDNLKTEPVGELRISLTSTVIE